LFFRKWFKTVYQKIRTKMQSATTRNWFIVGAIQRHRSIRLVFTIAELCRKNTFPEKLGVNVGILTFHPFRHTFSMAVRSQVAMGLPDVPEH